MMVHRICSWDSLMDAKAALEEYPRPQNLGLVGLANELLDHIASYLSDSDLRNLRATKNRDMQYGFEHPFVCEQHSSI